MQSPRTVRYCRVCRHLVARTMAYCPHCDRKARVREGPTRWSVDALCGFAAIILMIALWFLIVLT